MDLLRIFIRPRPTRLTCLIAGEVQAGVPRACMVLPLVGRGRGRGQPLQVGLRAAGDHPARQVRPRARSRAANEPLAKFSHLRRRPQEYYRPLLMALSKLKVPTNAFTLKTLC